ncbi:MAG TPA: HAD family hydrolase [Spirochaetia bacterium]|nr:HAD family hydrolase [Spirochaetia bacterium]
MNTNLSAIIRACSSPLSPIPTGMGSVLPPERPSPPIQAVLFDVYGTLFLSASGDIGQSEPSVPLGLGDLCARFGISDSPELVTDRFREEIIRIHRQKKMVDEEEAGEETQPEVRVEEIWAALYHFENMESAREFAVRYECLTNPVYPMPELSSVLERLAMKGLTMGIISNAQFFTPLLFEAFLEKPLPELGFDEELCIFSYVEGEAKPAPKLFQIARDRLLRRGIDPQSVLYAGNDMRNDVLCAQEAGFRTVLFAGDRRSLRLRTEDEHVQGVRPDWICTSLKEILSIC